MLDSVNSAVLSWGCAPDVCLLGIIVLVIKGTSLGCVLLNDIVKYFIHNGSPMYLCSLNGDKCFDTIWHDALLYKL